MRKRMEHRNNNNSHIVVRIADNSEVHSVASSSFASPLSLHEYNSPSTPAMSVSSDETFE